MSALLRRVGGVSFAKLTKRACLQQAEKEVHAFNDAPGEHHCDADGAKFDVLPKAIRNQGTFADPVSVVHPEYECWNEDERYD